MDFFGDDSFERMLQDFFGHSTQSRTNGVITGEQDERTIDFIETKNAFYLIFELPGYRKEDVSVDISKTEIDILAKRKVGESTAEYLAQKLNKGIHLKKPLPKSLAKKKFDWSFKNGVLEVKFRK